MYIGDMLIDDGATWTDNVDGTGIISHYNTGFVDTGAIGTYTIGYQHADIAGNTGSVTRTVNVNAHVVVDPIADTTPPVITLSGASSVNIEFGSDFVDDGASWTDNIDGTGIISRYNTGSVNTGAIGTYTIGYQHADVVGNTGSVTRTVNVVDTIRPSVTINTHSDQLDPTTTTGALYTVVFSEPINKSTFTK